jgi:CRISPR-associated protein Csc1
MSEIHIRRCNLTLHDYLFFATTRRGYVTETGQFIHNYSLTYALGWAKSEWHVERQEPQYAQQLSKVKGIYVTPANLLTGDSVLIPYRSETEGYGLSTITDSNGMSYGIIKGFRPGSVFRFYLLARFHLDEIPPLVRLGRSMAKAGIATQCPTELEVTEGDYTASSLLNWADMAVKPSLCDVIVYALPGRLIENARFVGTRYLKAEFVDGEEVRLPLEMGYFRKDLCSSWWEDAA